MYLSDFDLQQLDAQKRMGLAAKQKDGLLVKLLWDLKETRERLKANSQTSSRPPRSDPPWYGAVIHAPESCLRCGEALDPAGFVAHGGRYVLDLDTDRNAELPGLRIRHDKPLYGEIACGQCNETPWKEWGQLLWLWVLVTPTICLYFIGYRSKEILENVLGEGFVGWLMSDGYQVYRRFQKRLRCWAHGLRKADGLKESLSTEARSFGQATHDLLNELMIAIYEAREGPPVDLTPRFHERLESFRELCEKHQDSVHEKTRALAREFLNDWEAFWIVVAHPYLPLSNHEVGHRPAPQPGNPHRAGYPCLRPVGQCHRHLPATPHSALALPGQGDRRAAQRQLSAPATGCRLMGGGAGNRGG